MELDFSKYKEKYGLPEELSYEDWLEDYKRQGPISRESVLKNRQKSGCLLRFDRMDYRPEEGANTKAGTKQDWYKDYPKGNVHSTNKNKDKQTKIQLDS